MYTCHCRINNLDLCTGFFEIWILSIQMICYGFKVIESGIFFTETSDYFCEILRSSYKHYLQIWHFCVTYVEWVVCLTDFDIWLVSSNFEWIVTGTTCGKGNDTKLFPEHLISLPLGIHYFSYSLYIHYRICQSWDCVCGLMTALSQISFINLQKHARSTVLR